MQTRTFRWLAAALGLILAIPAWAEDRPAPERKFDGTYTIVRGVDEGKSVPAEHLKGSRVVITEGNIVSLDRFDKKVFLINYTLNTSKKPCQINMTIAQGKWKGKTAHGIIGWEGDTLKLCYALEGGEAPKDFTPKGGAHENCFDLKPVKTAAKEPTRSDR